LLHHLPWAIGLQTRDLHRYRAKDHAKDQGGTIQHEYSLIKGFSYVLLQVLSTCYLLLTSTSCNRVSFPKDSVSTLENHEHVKAVELDKEVKIQN
jgi:hypothetical protein